MKPEEALEWAKKAPMGDDEIIEVRQVQEFDDFPEDVQEAASAFQEIQEDAEARRNG